MSVFVAITSRDAAEARWRPEEGLGLQSFRLRQVADGYMALGAIVAEDEDGGAYGMDVMIDLRADWTVREAHMATTRGAELDLTHDGQGGWMVNGCAAPELTGCIDIDIWPTPFTNTLPVRRLKWRKGQTREMSMAYVRGPELDVYPDGQRYIYLGAIETGGRLFRFEALDGTFSADISFDADGLVTDYQSLFHRA